MTAILPTAGRTFARALLITTIAALALVTLKPAPASAYTVSSRGSYPGSVTGYVVQGSHYDTCPSTYYTCFTPWIVGSGPAVYRSPASTGNQTITVGYELQRWIDGHGWVTHGSRVHERTLYAGYSWLQMPRIDFLPNRGGHFRVIIGVAWGNYNDTVNFGVRKLTYNQWGDYTCNTRFPCQNGGSWVWLRSPGV